MNEPGRRILRRGLFLWASVTIVTLAFIGIRWLYPRVMGLYYQVQGGMQLRAVLQRVGVAESDALCLSAPFAYTGGTQDLEKAINFLKKAVRYNSSLARAYLLLGRSYCWLGKYQEATKYYEWYIELNPKDPLGHLELGINLATLNSYDQSLDVKARILQEWLIAGYKPENFISAADEAFKKKQYQKAAKFYLLGTLSDDDFLPTHNLRWIISSVIVYGQVPLQAELSPSTHIYELDNGSLQINAEEMIWTRNVFENWEPFGKLLRAYPSVDPNVGTMWWDGPAIAFVKIPESKLYRISLLAQETPPAPIKLRLELNFTSIVVFYLENQDLSWQHLETELFLPAGTYIIGIYFMNDEIANGVNKNAIIDYIKLKE